LDLYGKKQGNEDYKVFSAKEKYYYFTAKKGNKTIGAIKLGIHMDEGVAHIGAFIVSKEHRDDGVGSELLEKCEQLARKHKCKKIWLWAFPFFDSYKFYKKRGYVEEGRLKKQWGGKRDMCFMAKFL